MQRRRIRGSNHRGAAISSDDEDDEPLEKRASNSRRREAIKTFVARQLALGIPFEQIVAGAEENDLPTANLMRECYAEMQAA